MEFCWIGKKITHKKYSLGGFTIYIFLTKFILENSKFNIIQHEQKLYTCRNGLLIKV